jgi:hypothetical protein
MLEFYEAWNMEVCSKLSVRSSKLYLLTLLTSTPPPFTSTPAMRKPLSITFLGEFSTFGRLDVTKVLCRNIRGQWAYCGKKLLVSERESAFNELA